MSTYTPMKKNQTATPTEIIGFDLGHAETVATITMLGATKDPDPLEIQGDEDPTITAVAKDREGNVRIGEEAYRSRNLKSLQVMFKSPNLDDPEIRTPLQLFVQEILTQWVEGKHIEGGNNSLFIVGCPSGWGPQTQAAYAALLRDTGMKQVQVEKESRGAFLAARDSLKVSVDTLSGSVLIVDIGSSTTDFTHIVNMEVKPPKDFGSNVLGAGIIDRIIFERWRSAQDNAADITRMFKEFPYLEAVCLLHCRKLKEKYFKTKRADEEPVYLDERILFEGKTIPFSMELLDRDMDEIISTPVGEFLQQPNAELRNLGWQDAFRKVLQNAQEQTADDPPQMILLTGGASRMSFVLRCCEEVFPSAKVKRGKDPQYTIARGLALIGRTGNKLEQFRSEIRHVLKSGQLQKAIQTDSLKKLIDGIVDFLVPELERIILSAFRDWRNGHISTLNGMESATESRIKQYLESLKGPGAKKLGEKVIKDWIDTSVRPVVNDLFTPICDKAGIPDSSLRLSQDFSDHALHVRAMPSSDIEATDSLDNLSLIAAAIGAVIIATLLGGSGAALLMSGPIGWILGLIIGAIVMFVGREAAMDIARDIDMPEPLRWMMTSEEKVRKKLRENRSELRRQLSTALRKNASAFDETINGIAGMVKDELEEKAEEAAMLIK